MHVSLIIALTALMAVAIGNPIWTHYKLRYTVALTRSQLTIELACGDITTERVDAIVNAAKSSLLGGGGVDGAIHRAGGPAILHACQQLRKQLPYGLPAGFALITTAGHLPARWVIHTVGPVYDALEDQVAVLRSCYTKSLAAADAVGAETVAFPLISSGVYGWPVRDAVTQALVALRGANTQVRTVRLVLYDAPTYDIAETVMRDLRGHQ